MCWATPWTVILLSVGVIGLPHSAQTGCSMGCSLAWTMPATNNAGAAFFSSQDASQFSSEVDPQADHGRLQGVTERKRRGDGESRTTRLIVNLAPNTPHAVLILERPMCLDCMVPRRGFQPPK